MLCRRCKPFYLSQPGPATETVPGVVRLLIELAYFTMAVLALFHLHHEKLAWTMAGLLILHYLVSYDRVLWLLGR